MPRLFWAVITGVAAALLLLAGGEAALTVLQVSSIASAAPLSVIYALVVIALARMLRYEMATMPRYVRVRPRATPSALVSTARQQADDEEELQRNLRGLLKAQSNGTPSRGNLKHASAALGGLAVSPAAKPSTSTTNGVDTGVLAVYDVPARATTVDAETGTIASDDDSAFRNPIGGEVFDPGVHRLRRRGRTRDRAAPPETRLRQRSLTTPKQSITAGRPHERNGGSPAAVRWRTPVLHEPDRPGK
ncbi:hypothetical protein FHX42_001323 [Saccharopolyspora lacisalsi]|uniref:Uncharacterized protein n=1 Tax=Halosaccharopolyspora lacisalsi TaxID=1000566 RepID=A0A839DR50_9PSEU|nr:hypothetical protein [Halosaccharopolyspora lacisalsi]